MTPVYQTRRGPPDGNCMAACVATLLDKRIEDVDVDVANCGNSVKTLLAKIEERAGCKVYALDHQAIVDRVVKSGERYCIVSVCSCVYDSNPSHPNSTWHCVVCEIAAEGQLRLVFNPDRADQRTQSLQEFAAIGQLFIVKRTPAIRPVCVV
jgi:hypothetical protein